MIIDSEKSDVRNENRKNIWYYIYISYPMLFISILYLFNAFFCIHQYYFLNTEIFHDTYSKNFYNKIYETEILSVYVNDISEETDLIYFGGSELNLGEISNIYFLLKDKHFNCIFPIYKGFEKKEQQNEILFMIQINALVDIIKHRKKKVYVLGYSLGCSLALYFNKVYVNVDRIILAAPFYSFGRCFAEKFPYLWFLKYFVSEKYENNERIKYCKNTIYIIVGKYDQAIKYQNTLDLWEIIKESNCDMSNKHLKIYDQNGHNDIIDEKIVNCL